MKELHDNTIITTKEKDSWIEHYSNCAIERIKPSTKCGKSWQDDMIIKIKEKIINEFIEKTSINEFEELKLSLQLNNIEIKN